MAQELELWDLFYFRNFSQSQKSQLEHTTYSRKGIFLLRKMMVLFIMLMDLTKCFLNLKSGEEIFKTQISASTHALNRSKVEAILLNQDHFSSPGSLKYAVDPALLLKPLSQLVALVDVCFFQKYLLLTHVYLTKKFSSKQVRLRLKGSEFEFQFSLKEQEQIFCSKSKRRDELIKFSYKFIRKQIFRDYKKSLQVGVSNEAAKRSFYQEILENNREAVDYFNSVDVSKKHLKKFRNCPRIVSLIHDFKDESYIEQQIETNIFKKAETIFRDDLTFGDFLKCLFCGQHKHSVILQDIINSHNIFHLFFQL